MSTQLNIADSRPLTLILALPSQAWITPQEAAAILGLTRNALAARRSRSEWPNATRLGPRLIRYRLGDLLCHSEYAEQGGRK